MSKVVYAALAVAIVTGGSVSHAGVILTDENMDLVTAGLTFDSYSTSAITDDLLSSTSSSSSTSIVIGNTTLFGKCSGNTCAVTVTTSAGYSNTCSSCTLTVNQSGITVVDTSGHVWYTWTGMPQNNPVVMLVNTTLAP